MPLLRFRYRAFLSKKQVDEFVRPSPDTVELACAWLAHNGIRSSSISRTHGGTWLTVTDLRVSQASQLLGASYQLYRHMKTNETIIRTVGYSLPEVLHRHVQTVMPTTYFSSMEVTVQTPHRRTFGPAPAQMQARQPHPDHPLVVEPSNLRWLYGTVEYHPVAYGPGKNTLAVVGNRLPRQQDLTAFMDAYREEDAAGATFNIENVDGEPLNLWELPDDTSSVAVQYATAMAYPTPLSVFRVLRTEDAFVDFIYFLLGMEPVPWTIGISFNYFFEETLSLGDANFLCNLFAQLGARGASVLVASGNTGVGGEDCNSFVVEFPSSCMCDVYHPFQSLHKREYKSLTGPCFAGPWVTSVGGTENMNPEVATFLSGGGFSHYFPRPSYQANAVVEYLDGAEYPYFGRYKYVLP